MSPRAEGAVSTRRPEHRSRTLQASSGVKPSFSDPVPTSSPNADARLRDALVRRPTLSDVEVRALLKT